MNRWSMAALLIAMLLFLIFRGLAPFNPLHKLANWTPEDTTRTDIQVGGHARLLSAFFGLDSSFPWFSRFLICPRASGHDGMPVIFSRELDFSTLQAGDFEVIRESGERGSVVCATLMPADDDGELRTVLLVGDLGSAEDQPAVVRIKGNILSAENEVNFKGASVNVIPLEAGPSITLAQVPPRGQWRLGKAGTRLPFGGGTGCPAETKLALRVVWQGGVTRHGGSEIGDEERSLYRVSFDQGGQRFEAAPFALGDLRDNDNNHLLCFDFVAEPREVSFPGGYLTDPRDDFNPATSMRVSD